MIMKYEFIEINIPYEVINIQEVNLIEKINEHHKLTIKTLIDNENIEKYIEKNAEDKKISVSIHNKIVYNGKLAKVEVIYEKGLAYLRLEALSYSKDLDIMKKKKAFINVNETYENIIKNVLNKYKKYNYKDNLSNGDTINDMLVQYEETDWEFLKRLASAFNSVLLVDSCDESIRINFGMEKLSKQINIADNYEEVINNFNDNIEEFHKDFITFKLTSKKYYPLGSNVNLQGQEVYIIKVEMKNIRNEILFFYELKELKGINTKEYSNPKLKGITLEAIVKKVRKNQMQVSFCINDSYEDDTNNKWFDYCREVNDFYVMPLVEVKLTYYLLQVMKMRQLLHLA